MVKSSKNGFTLIELLAVIVILAVIALIATPIIMNVINDSKEGSAKDAMYGYVKAVELATVNTITATMEAVDGVYKVNGGNLVMDTETLNVNFKGSKPKDDGYVILRNGQVVESGLNFGGYCIKYDGSKAEVSNNCGAQKTYNAGDIIYYNSEANKKCTASEVNAVANAKTGCLKWNVVTMGDTTSNVVVDIMLDHNTTAKVAWNSSGKNADGMKEVATALETDVTTWNTAIKSTARLISGQEIANIGKDTEWNPEKYTGTIYSTQSWLYQNLSSGNTVEKPYGYWTSTVNSSNSLNTWNVYYIGFLSNLDVAHAAGSGLRPVISVSKSVIS